MSQQYIEVELAGKTRLLRIDYNAVCEIEEKFGKGVHAVLSSEQIGLRALRIFYWAALKWKDPGLTLDRVGQMLHKEITENGANLSTLFEPVMNALKQSKILGNAEEEAESEEGNAESGPSL